LHGPAISSAAGKKIASIGNHINTIHHVEAYRSIIKKEVGVFGYRHLLLVQKILDQIVSFTLFLLISKNITRAIKPGG